MLEVQGRDGTWNYDPYMLGLYNGMEYSLALMEDREPIFRDAPDKFLRDHPRSYTETVVEDESEVSYKPKKLPTKSRFDLFLVDEKIKRDK